MKSTNEIQSRRPSGARTARLCNLRYPDDSKCEYDVHPTNPFLGGDVQMKRGRSDGPMIRNARAKQNQTGSSTTPPDPLGNPNMSSDIEPYMSSNNESSDSEPKKSSTQRNRPEHHAKPVSYPNEWATATKDSAHSLHNYKLRKVRTANTTKKSKQRK